MRFLFLVVVVGCGVTPPPQVVVITGDGAARWQRVPAPPNRPGDECWALVVVDGAGLHGVICTPPLEK